MEVPRRNIVAHNRVDDQKRYCDMKITIKPRVEDMRNYIELMRTLFEEDHGYTYRGVVYVVKFAGKKLVIIHVKRSDNLCWNFQIIKVEEEEEGGGGVSYDIEGYRCWWGERVAKPGSDLIVLPMQRAGQPPKWLHIKIVEEDTGSWIIAVVRSDNMYCKGIITMDWRCHELLEKDDPRTRRLPRGYHAEKAGCLVSYPSMIGCEFEYVRQKLMDDLGLGFYSATRSVQILSQGTCFPLKRARAKSKDNPGMAMASLIFSLLEPTRMNFFYSGLDAENDRLYWSIGPKLASQLWDLAQNWKHMSYTVLDCWDTGVWTRNEYLDKIGKYSLEDTEEALSIVLNSTEGWYRNRIVGKKNQTRMDLVIERDKEQAEERLKKKRNGSQQEKDRFRQKRRTYY
jgi:hypothetical protein